MLWACPLGWNYLTEENAARSMDVFVELIQYMAELENHLPR